MDAWMTSDSVNVKSDAGGWREQACRPFADCIRISSAADVIAAEQGDRDGRKNERYTAVLHITEFLHKK